MPTLDNETPIERQQREREVELAHYARMTPVEIERLVIDKHNAEARRDELLTALKVASAYLPVMSPQYIGARNAIAKAES